MPSVRPRSVAACKSKDLTLANRRLGGWPHGCSECDPGGVQTGLEPAADLVQFHYSCLRSCINLRHIHLPLAGSKDPPSVYDPISNLCTFPTCWVQHQR